MGLSEVETIQSIGKTKIRHAVISARCTRTRARGWRRKVLLKGEPAALTPSSSRVVHAAPPDADEHEREAEDDQEENPRHRGGLAHPQELEGARSEERRVGKERPSRWENKGIKTTDF